ncbi:HIT domain-containing protein [soil metagenome]
MTSPIWAPWRMEYILGPKAEGCIFCELPDRTPAADHLVLAVTREAFVCLNRYPFAAGHLLVIPRRHASDLGELGEEESDALFRLARITVGRLRKALNPQGVNVGMNLGKAAGAGIAEHLHVHVVPRWDGDTNFMPVLADVRVMPEHLNDTHEQLFPFFEDLSS